MRLEPTIDCQGPPAASDTAPVIKGPLLSVCIEEFSFVFQYGVIKVGLCYLIIFNSVSLAQLQVNKQKVCITHSFSAQIFAFRFGCCWDERVMKSVVFLGEPFKICTVDFYIPNEEVTLVKASL